MADFQHFTLNGLDVGSAMNSGQRSLDELMRLLDRADRFRNWLDGKPIETDLAASYLREVAAGTWAASLPAKLVRLAILLSAGTILGGHLGTAVGAALGAGDMLLLERLAAGWKPNQFIEKDLNPFMGQDEIRVISGRYQSQFE